MNGKAIKEVDVTFTCITNGITCSGDDGRDPRSAGSLIHSDSVFSGLICCGGNMAAEDDGVVDCDCWIRPQRGKCFGFEHVFVSRDQPICCFSINIQLATGKDGKTDRNE